MPTLEDWIDCPYNIIKNLKVDKDEEWSQSVYEYFKKHITNQNAAYWVPSLNAQPFQLLPAESLVKFRCMIQDMYDPEFYLGHYEVEDENTHERSMMCGKYRDSIECKENLRVNYNSSKNVTMERRSYFCVPIPAENAWVKHTFNEQENYHKKPAKGSNGEGLKRTYNECQSESDSSTIPVSMDTDTNSHKQSKSEHSSTNESKDGLTEDKFCTNFPLPEETGTPCIVKVYDPHEYKLNQQYEFYGILTYDKDSPQSTKTEEKVDAEMELDDYEPPAAIVPRIHVVYAAPLKHNNPLLPQELTDQQISEFQTEALNMRKQLLEVLKLALLDNDLVAEYLLCHLISHVYARRDEKPFGTLPLNIYECKPELDIPTRLSTLLKKLVSKSYLLSMKLSVMNNQSFVPCKDYEANRLTSGVLQLTKGTQLILDETALHTGELNTKGIQNLSSLSSLLSFQRLAYDFKYHQQNFDTDIKVIILSEGKTILKNGFYLPLCAASKLRHCSDGELLNHVESSYAAIDQILDAEGLRRLQSYLTMCHFIPYTVDPEMQKVIEDDFVEIRKTNPDSMSPSDLENLLLLAKYQSVSLGKSTLTEEVWKSTKLLEITRKSLCSNTPHTNNSS